MSISFASHQTNADVLLKLIIEILRMIKDKVPSLLNNAELKRGVFFKRFLFSNLSLWWVGKMSNKIKLKHAQEIIKWK